MPNTNCLCGMQCPKCKSFEPFAIEITTTVRVFDDGTDDQLSDTHWEDDSYCECGKCTFTGTVKDFAVSESGVAA